MPPTFFEPDDDLLEQELVNYQQQLESGIPPGPEQRDRTGPVLSPELQQSLIGLKRCLDLLNETRQESASSDERSPSRIADSGYAIPEKIGKFVITELLGIGGFGIVFKGIDQGINRQVAIKIPKPEHLPNLDLIQRFTGEASAVAQLEHPNIVPVYESSQYGITPYIVMPFVGGKTLDDWMAGQGVIPTRTAAELIWQLAEGVAHAHERKILHRDIKPGNVLLEPRDSESNTTGLPFVPRLTDFGLAKSTEATRGGTITGTVIGTVCYMSPEQASGKTDDIQRPADVYSLGAILYELLCGVPPFRGETDVQTVLMLLKDEVRSPALLRKDLPRDLEVICLKCLEKSPAQRYSSARELADDLRRYLDGKPIQAKPNTRIERLEKWCRRNPVKASLSLVAGLAVTSLISVSLWYNSRLTGLLEISEENRAAVLAQSTVIRRRACLSDVRLSQMAWDQGHVEQALRLLERHLPKQGETDVRHFAWWHMWKQCTGSSQLLGEHAGGATAVAVSADGKWGASGGKDSLIRMYSLPDCQEQATIRPEISGGINALDFSPDGKHLASATEAHTVQIWDVAAQRLTLNLQGHTESVLDVAFSADGKTVASAGGDLVVRLWDAASGSLRGMLSGHTKAITGIAFHPHEPMLVSTAKDGTIRLWDLNAMSLDKRLPDGIINRDRPEDWIRPIVLSPGGKTLVGGAILTRLVEWSLEESDFGQFVHNEIEEHANARSFVWPDHGTLTIGHTSGGIRVTDSSDLNIATGYLQGHSAEVTSLDSTPDGRILLSASADGTVRKWWTNQVSQLLKDHILTAQLPGERVRIGKVSWSNLGIGVKLDTVVIDSDRNTMAGGSSENLKYCLLQDLDGKILSEIDYLNKEQVYLSPSGKHLLRFNLEGELRLLNTSGSKLLWETKLTSLPSGELKKPHAVFDPDEKYLLITWGKRVVMLSVEDGRNLQQAEFPESVLHAAIGSWNHESVVFLACYDGKVVVWDFQNWIEIESRQLLPEKELLLVAISADGEYLATGSQWGAVVVWNTSHWTRRAAFSHADAIQQISFLQDSRTLVVRDVQTHFWDIANEMKLLGIPADAPRLIGHPDDDRLLKKSSGEFAVSPDGMKVAVPVFNEVFVVDANLGK